MDTGAIEILPNEGFFRISNRKLLILIVSLWLIILTAISAAVSWQFGFHRDELNFIENARYLDWGYVEYPPFSPLVARMVLELFGPSIVALRFAATLAVCVSMLLTGIMTLEMGGSRAASVVATLATGSSAYVIFSTRFFSYQTFDFLFWVLISYFVIKLINSGDPRWWLAIGATIGMGLQNKYSIPFFALGLAGGVLLTYERHYLKSKWVRLGVLVAIVIFIPNFIWQIQHNFVSLEHQADMRSYNIEVGRTADYLIAQFYVATNPAAIPLWGYGLYFSLFAPQGKKYRMLGWMYIIPLVLFLVASGRFYYMAPTYPMMIALGAARLINRPGSEQNRSKRTWRNIQYGSLAVLGILFMAVMIPITAPGSAWWRLDYALNSEIGEEIGWPEMVKEVSRLYHELPEDERAQTGIMAMNYGEASAINIYGPEMGLPNVISGENTFWYRGYGDNPPQKLIVVGLETRYVKYIFNSCKVIGQIPNPYDIENQELRETPDILYCEGLIEPWPEFWSHFRHYG
ncbi:MAG: ArnT family glycosyltransferase [Anaerolineaceae bacterium]